MLAAPRPESFPPPALLAPRGRLGWLAFALRLALDVRVGAIWRCARQTLPRWSGLVLDVGCGDGPWRWLLPPSATYVGLDVPRAASGFGYAPGQPRQVVYGGGSFPFADASFEHLLCTEVLEHVEEPAAFLRECGRVCRPGGTCFFSVPFAARYHYIPFDYWRFTPAGLRRLFEGAGWREVAVLPLGTDVTVAAYKAAALILKLTLASRPLPGRLLTLGLALLLSPIYLALAALQNLSTLARWGSDADPLGYVVLARRDRAGHAAAGGA